MSCKVDPERSWYQDINSLKKMLLKHIYIYIVWLYPITRAQWMMIIRLQAFLSKIEMFVVD